MVKLVRFKSQITDTFTIGIYMKSAFRGILKILSWRFSLNCDMR